MIRPSRLFWKLFLAFWLATSLTFLAGLAILLIGRFFPGDPQIGTVFFNTQHVIERFGVEAGEPLLTVWADDLHGQQIGLYDQQGQLLAGKPVPADKYNLKVTAKDGRVVWLRAPQNPGSPEGKGPSHAIPLVVGTIMSALFSWYLAYYLVWPLVHLRRAMHSVAQGRFDTRVKPIMGRRRDEIVDLAEDCDRMATQLKLLVDAQQHLLHDISHELRSPLTRMRAAIGLLLQDPHRLEMLGRIERESERIDILIEELLTLARVQGRPESLDSERLDVIELLADIVEDAQFEAGIKHCTVQLDAPESFVSCVNGELLYRCFENVVRNAVRYTWPSTTVRVVAVANAAGDSLTVRITDQGPGVEHHRLQSIFSPFERGVAQPAAGFGLGLAIAQRAVELHGGRISASNLPEGGLSVAIHLPRRA
ncbi:histidine kinase, Classic [Pseudomonas sp. M47T1]|uniref:HAMP domain-containing sensor histidine kinase n=1 Tax=unclassified Pseudomonas TaxID=196821 RepID=UPI0002607299|nr:ATP-binding protein [Pseudomonas sp. M47T1]EIK95746.1 histidine kinase, Classic [Pseudomonas sp. M47T1]